MVPRFTDGRPAREPISLNRFFSEEKAELSIDGVRLEVYMIPGERADHVAVWLPDSQVLFAGDHVYGSFPNLYPIRGSVYRDVERWARGVRRLVAFAPKAVMFGYNHVPAWEEYLPMTENYARVIESVYEQTIQGNERGQDSGRACHKRAPARSSAHPSLSGRHLWSHTLGCTGDICSEDWLIQWQSDKFCAPHSRRTGCPHGGACWWNRRSCPQGRGGPGEGRLITLAKRPKEEGSRQTPLML